MRRLALAAFCAVATIAGAAGPAALAQPAATPAAAARLNPNTATTAQLARVPGLTPAIAAQIVQARPFATIGDFDKFLTGKLGAEKAKAVYPSLFVPINLNTASRADIMLVPGMTPRMAHEFEEYRPYTSMDQFNREIGKYVPPPEVARLASYVALR